MPKAPSELENLLDPNELQEPEFDPDDPDEPDDLNPDPNELQEPEFDPEVPDETGEPNDGQACPHASTLPLFPKPTDPTLLLLPPER